MLYDGRLLWSDLDHQTTLCLTDFVTLQDTQYVRNAAAAMINNPSSVTGKLIYLLFYGLLVILVCFDKGVNNLTLAVLSVMQPLQPG